MELNNQPSKLLQTVKDLKDELQTVNEDNERILRAQEELNQILLDNLHKEGKDKSVQRRHLPTLREGILLYF